MTPLGLRAGERQGLEAILHRPCDASSLRRAQALLWLDKGESIQEVATRLQLSRQVIYNWVRRVEVRAVLPLAARVADGLRPRRPRTVTEVIDPVLEVVIDEDLHDWGYTHGVWTASLLQQHLADVHQLSVSRPSVSLALVRLRIRWKRPRHHLARRSPTWRQAKGSSAQA